jgi:hypothetical protein
MPITSFANLPDDARLWVFAASNPISPERSSSLLTVVDEWLDDWKAHGEPLTSAREWRDDRFLVIGVDQSTAGASGCSIDALFRILQTLQSQLGTSLVGGGRVFYQNRAGAIESSTRAGFSERANAGAVDADTIVYDTAITSAADYRRGFARRAGDSWHRELLETGDRPRFQRR